MMRDMIPSLALIVAVYKYILWNMTMML